MFWVFLFIVIWFGYIINNFKLAHTLSECKRDAKKKNIDMYTLPDGKTRLTSNEHEIINTNLYERNVSIDKQTNRIIRDDTLIYSSYNNMIESIYKQKEIQKALDEGKRFLHKGCDSLVIMDYDFSEPYTTIGIGYNPLSGNSIYPK